MENKELLVLNEGSYLLDGEVAKKLVDFKRMMDELKTKQSEIQELIKKEMIEKNIKQIKDEINGVTISYVEPTERETFNSKKFRAEHEDLYDEYVNFSSVKDSVRISIK